MLLATCDVDASFVEDAKVIASELATNAVLRGAAPYELRLIFAGSVPIACEVADADPDVHGIPGRLTKPPSHPGPELAGIDRVPEAGRGLGIVHVLTGGRCGVRATTLCGTGQAAKGIWFGLPAGGAVHRITAVPAGCMRQPTTAGEPIMRIGHG